MKNLIRNGGFERATIDFWTAYTAASFAVSGVTPYKGTYCGHLVVAAGQKPHIMPNDYIPLVQGETAYFEAWVRGSHAVGAYLYAVYYDEGLNEIDSIRFQAFTLSTTGYEQVLYAISGIEGAIYCRPKLELNDTTAGRYMKIDNVLMYKYDPGKVIAQEDELEDRSTVAVAGTVYGKYHLATAFREVELVLNVVACLGAAETLDVTVETRESESSASHTIATFEQVTGAQTPVSIVLTEGIGTRIRVKSVIGGAPTNITYKVTALFKR